MVRLLPFAMFLLLIITSCGDGRNFAPIDIKDVDRDDIYMAGNVLDAILTHCDSGNFEKFADYSYITPKMYQLLRYSEFANTCQAIEEHVGAIESKELKEVLYYNGILKIFRFKIQCEKQEHPIEFRVALTMGESRLSEYRFYEWQDTFNKEIIRMKWF